jgi:hypothetical protein
VSGGFHSKVEEVAFACAYTFGDSGEIGLDLSFVAV